MQKVASGALGRCAAGASAWAVRDMQEHVAPIVTEAGVRATGDELREFISITTRLAAEDCLSILPLDAPRPERVAHLTTLHVVAVETGCATSSPPAPPRARTSPTLRLNEAGLDAGQSRAAAVAPTAPLVAVEGAASAGNTTWNL